MIEPTVGRVVWYRPEGPNGPTLTALICGVNDERSINVALFDMYGNHQGGRTNVYLWPGDHFVRPDMAYCEWMPYQKGQAAKTENLEASLSAAGKVARNLAGAAIAATNDQVLGARTKLFELDPSLKLPSAFGIGHRVILTFLHEWVIRGTVVGVHFTESKVTYDIDLDVGGVPLRNVDSAFVSATN